MPPGGPRWARAEKPRDMSASLLAFLKYIGPYRKDVALGIAFSILGTILMLIGPQYLASITDSLSASVLGSTPIDMDFVFSTGILLVVIYALGELFTTLEMYIIGASSEKIGAKMREDASRKISRLPMKTLDSSSTGDLMSRMTNDTDTISNSCSESITNTVTAITMLVGSVAMMFYTDWHLASVAIIAPLIGFVVLFVITHCTQKYFIAQQRDLGRMNSLVEESYYGHDIVTAYNGGKGIRERFDSINSRLFDSAYKASAVTGLVPQTMNFIGNISYVVVCVAGSMLIAQGTIGYGVIVACILYVRQFTQPIVMLAESTSQMQSVTSASERIFELLAMEEMPPQEDAVRLEPSEVKGDVSFRGVRFGYVPGREIIHGLDLEVPHGSQVSIVGPTGAGKTTIANLLMRFYEADSGDILVDGVPIGGLSRANVHDLFSMVLQDSWLFDGTIRENIAYTTPDVSDEDVVEACRSVGLQGLIDSLPDGLDTRISESSGLSVGQRQQITIARAIIKDAPMIILDEATSSVDTVTEKQIQAAVGKLTEGKTSFVIAHRLSTIRDSDVILVMRGGEIVEKGTHQELLDLGGFYRELYDSQFEECG